MGGDDKMKTIKQVLMLLAEIISKKDFLDRPIEARLLACSNAIQRLA